MNIVVLAGGLSNERDVSICTGEMVCNALKDRGHNAVLVDLFFGYQGDGRNWDEVFEKSRKSTETIDAVGDVVPDINKMKAQRGDGSRIGTNIISLCKSADIVFMALHGEDGENGKVQAMFDLNGIKYTGAGYFSSAVSMNKDVSKQIFVQKNINTPKYNILHNGNYEINELDISYPCVVKPCSGGSSIGVSIVESEDELFDAIDKAKHYEKDIIIEEYIKGREFSIGGIEGKALPIIELIPKHGFYDYANKYQKGFTEEICPAELDSETTKRMQNEAEKAFSALNIEVYARIDFMLSEDNDI